MDDEEQDELFFKRIDRFLKNYRIAQAEFNLDEFGLQSKEVHVCLLMWAFDNNLEMTFIN